VSSWRECCAALPLRQNEKREFLMRRVCVTGTPPVGTSKCHAGWQENAAEIKKSDKSNSCQRIGWVGLLFVRASASAFLLHASLLCKLFRDMATRFTKNSPHDDVSTKGNTQRRARIFYEFF
jgi:hypothetical protein